MREPEASSGSGAGTGEDVPPAGAVARLIVQVAGETSPRSVWLTGTVARVGRDPENEVTVDVPYLSRHAVTIRRFPGHVSLEPVEGALTTVTYRGRVLTRPVGLADSDYFRLEGDGPGEAVNVFYANAAPGAEAPARRRLALREGATVRIGSAAGSDIGEGSPLLEGEHATLSREGGATWLTPAGDATVMANGSMAFGRTHLAPGASVSAGDVRITVDEDGVEFWVARSSLVMGARRGREMPEEVLLRLPGTGGAEVVARDLTRQAGDLTILDGVSLRFMERELVALVGLSGAGKSTLLNALTGFRPADSGEVLINGLNLYENRDHFRSLIGYVPQRDIVHQSLTVFEALDYAARLRLPPGTSEADRHARIQEVLADLGLEERRDTRISNLSGGQVKRVSIGVELISQPQLMFLDEPTSGLDPATETDLMRLLRRLADQGRTIVVITHATKNVMIANKVIFLVRGGRVAWFGPPAEAIDYFDRQRSEAERADRPLEFDEIYRLLDQPERGSAADWQERFRQDAAAQRYLPRPVEGGTPSAARAERVEPQPQPGPLRQLLVLSGRNLRLLGRDRFALLLVIAAAPLLASLDFLITKRDMFDAVSGDPARIITNTNTMIVNAMLVGALAQMREIIKDRDIYRRERLVSLRLFPYVLSKVWIAGLLALYQAVWWVAIRYAAVDMPGGWDVATGFYVTMFLATFAGMMLGLFASAASPSEDAVALIVALLIVPQVLFSGAHLPAHELSPVVRSQMDIMPSRWAFEALTTLGGHGTDVANDRCWLDTTPEQRAAMTPEEKQACTCLGESIFESCGYPGVQSQRALVAAGGAGASSAVLLAEGRLEVGYEGYGPVYDVNVPLRWGALVVIITALGGIIYGIQRLRDRVR